MRRHLGEVGRELRRVAHRHLDLAADLGRRRQAVLERPLHDAERELHQVAGELRVEVQRQAAQRRHHVAQLRLLARVHGEREPLHERVHLQVERRGELDIGRQVAERPDAEELRRSCQGISEPKRRSWSRA